MGYIICWTPLQILWKKQRKLNGWWLSMIIMIMIHVSYIRMCFVEMLNTQSWNMTTRWNKLTRIDEHVLDTLSSLHSGGWQLEQVLHLFQGMPGRNLQDLAVFLGNCLVSYGVMPKIRHLFCWNSGLCSFRQAVWPLTTWLGHLEIVPVKSGPALLQKILIHANTLQIMQRFMNYPTVIFVIHGDDLTFFLEVYRLDAVRYWWVQWCLRKMFESMATIPVSRDTGTF